MLAEEFTYSGTLNMLLSKRAEVIHVESDVEGMNPDALVAEIKRLAAGGRKPKFIYAISVYQNPTGSTLSLERRERLLEIASEYDILIVENESYADFRIDGDPLPPAMLGMDDNGMVIYVSSYTKLNGLRAACGLRGRALSRCRMCLYRRHAEPVGYDASVRVPANAQGRACGDCAA